MSPQIDLGDATVDEAVCVATEAHKTWGGVSVRRGRYDRS
jgi:hypothetical protein